MATWNAAKKRWQASLGTDKQRIWFFSQIEGQAGHDAAETLKRNYKLGPVKLRPGCVAEFVESVWWPSLKAKKRSHETRRVYMSEWKNVIEPAFGSMLLTEVTSEHLQRFVYDLIAKFDKPHTVKNKYGVLQSILAEAYRLNRIKESFKDKVWVPKVPKKTMRESRDRSQVKDILRAVEGTVYEVPVWAQIMMMLRHGELFGLYPEDIELRKDRAIVTLGRSRQRHETREQLKNREEGEIRVFAIPLEWAHRLLSCQIGADNEPLFRGVDGSPMKPSTYSETVRRRLEKVGIKVTCKEFRHLGVSRFRELNIHSFTTRDVAGHTDDDMTYAYTDSNTAASLKAFKAVQKHFGV